LVGRDTKTQTRITFAKEIKMKQLSLQERIDNIDPIQGRRFSKLTGVAREIAIEGITRNLTACDNQGVEPDSSPIREIIDDALNGRRVFAEPHNNPNEDDGVSGEFLNRRTTTYRRRIKPGHA
jgi:hypothetical protein